MADSEYSLQEATEPPPEVVDDSTPLVEKLKSYGAATPNSRSRQSKDPSPPSRPLDGRSVEAGVAPNVAFFQTQPTDHVTAAWLVTFLCFFPVGLFALYYAHRTKREYGRGQLRSARHCSRRARCLIQVAVAFGLITWFIGLVAAVIVYQDQTSGL